MYSIMLIKIIFFLDLRAQQMKTGGYLHKNIFDDRHLHQFSINVFNCSCENSLKLFYNSGENAVTRFRGAKCPSKRMVLINLKLDFTN